MSSSESDARSGWRLRRSATDAACGTPISTRTRAELAQLIRAVGRRIGFDITRRSPRRSPDLRRIRLLEDASVSVVLDVGANRGDYGAALRRDGYAGRIVSVEPLSDSFRSLGAASATDRLWSCHRVALGDMDGEATIHVAANHGASSSFLDMTDTMSRVAPEVRYVSDEIVDVRRLDDLYQDLIEVAERCFLKLDVQGFEHEVLRGGQEALNMVIGLEIELSLAPLYAGQPLLHDVLGELHEAGFALVSLEPAFVAPDTGHVLQVDAMLVRNDVNMDQPNLQRTSSQG